MPNPPPTAKTARPGVGLFAKPPVPGKVKTRLVPPLLPTAAAALYAAFLADQAAMLERAGIWDWVLYSTDLETQRAAWPDSAPAPAAWRQQSEGDLGARLGAALGELLGEGRGRAVLLGSDHPTVTALLLSQAFEALLNADLVLGPTQDGGYYLVGASSPLEGLFDDIPWSTDRVFASTMERARRRGWRTAVLPPGFDVDTPQDLGRLRAQLEAIRIAGSPAMPCPRTWEVLRSLNLSGL